jgi:hypothetical protein
MSRLCSALRALGHEVAVPIHGTLERAHDLVIAFENECVRPLIMVVVKQFQLHDPTDCKDQALPLPRPAGCRRWI